MDSVNILRIVAAVLTVTVLGIIVYRRSRAH